MKSSGSKGFLCFMLLMLLCCLGGCVPGNATSTQEQTVSETKEEEGGTDDTSATEDTLPDEETTEESSAEDDGKRYRLNEGSPLSPLPYYAYDVFKDYWDVENSAEMLWFTAENGDGHAQYLEDLTAAGFVLYAESEMAGNRYSTWVGKDTNVTVMYTPADSSVRILAEPSTIGLPGLAADNVYTDQGYENLVVQIGSYYGNASKNGGMSYIYRLCDGSFIVVDAGYGEEHCADSLYETLAKYAPDPNNIVIAAFFLSHTHVDHVGGFYQFVDKYKDKMTIEQFIYNYPIRQIYQLTGTKVQHLAQTPQYIKKLNGCKVIEARPGQKFYIRDAEIEMLYTWELLGMEQTTDMNNTSLVFSIKLGDTKVMQLGDCGPQASPVVHALYGDYLKSDIIQVAHHGGPGATLELNQAIDADVVLYPAGKYNFEIFYEERYNSLFKDAEYLYLSHSSATMLPLPFDPERVETWELLEP